MVSNMDAEPRGAIAMNFCCALSHAYNIIFAAPVSLQSHVTLVFKSSKEALGLGSNSVATVQKCAMIWRPVKDSEVQVVSRSLRREGLFLCLYQVNAKIVKAVEISKSWRSSCCSRAGMNMSNFFATLYRDHVPTHREFERNV